MAAFQQSQPANRKQQKHMEASLEIQGAPPSCNCDGVANFLMPYIHSCCLLNAAHHASGCTYTYMELKTGVRLTTNQCMNQLGMAAEQEPKYNFMMQNGITAIGAVRCQVSRPSGLARLPSAGAGQGLWQGKGKAAQYQKHYALKLFHTILILTLRHENQNDMAGNIPMQIPIYCLYSTLACCAFTVPVRVHAAPPKNILFLHSRVNAAPWKYLFYTNRGLRPSGVWVASAAAAAAAATAAVAAVRARGGC